MKLDAWVQWVLLAGLSWGTYVPLIFYGGSELGGKSASRILAILCVGVAYFLIAVLIPALALRQRQGTVARLVDDGVGLFRSRRCCGRDRGTVRRLRLKIRHRRGQSSQLAARHIPPLHRAAHFWHGPRNQYAGQLSVAPEAGTALSFRLGRPAGMETVARHCAGRRWSVPCALFQRGIRDGEAGHNRETRRAEAGLVERHFWDAPPGRAPGAKCGRCLFNLAAEP